MNPFQFCPSCAAPIDEPDRNKGSICSNCGRHWYRNPSPTVGAAIVRDGKVLLTVRAGDPYEGKIDLPGGFLHADERAIDGLRREVDEELGIEIEVMMDDCLQTEPHRYGDDGEWTLAIGFQARLVSGVPTPSDDVAEVMWVEDSDLDDLDFAWPHDRVLAREALRRAERKGER
jgi:ADP-ribose pyrophosphatase YjhB (NUDIX family)